jgi:hypothetical protein
MPHACVRLHEWIAAEREHRQLCDELIGHLVNVKTAVDYDIIEKQPVFQRVIPISAPIELEYLIPSTLGTCAPDVTAKQRKKCDKFHARLQRFFMRSYTLQSKNEMRNGDNMELIMSEFTQKLTYEWLQAHVPLCRDYVHYVEAHRAFTRFMQRELPDMINDARHCHCCAKLATTRCTGCLKVFYCSVECQTKNRAEHVTFCKANAAPRKQTN